MYYLWYFKNLVRGKIIPSIELGTGVVLLHKLNLFDIYEVFLDNRGCNRESEIRSKTTEIFSMFLDSGLDFYSLLGLVLHAIVLH